MNWREWGGAAGRQEKSETTWGQGCSLKDRKRELWDLTSALLGFLTMQWGQFHLSRVVVGIAC